MYPCEYVLYSCFRSFIRVEFADMSKQIGPESLPILPILDTEEILEGMGGQWGAPVNDRRHGVGEVDSIALQWIGFCEHAKKGQQILASRTFSGDLISLRSSRAFMESLQHEDVPFPQIITTIESAFAQLLSAKAQKRISNLEIKPNISVDDKLRNQIKVLVSNMGYITNSYIQERRKEWEETYGDDD